MFVGSYFYYLFKQLNGAESLLFINWDPFIMSRLSKVSNTSRSSLLVQYLIITSFRYIRHMDVEVAFVSARFRTEIGKDTYVEWKEIGEKN